MNLVFTNPWGFLGLLGIPALVLIYYLRRRAQVVTVSTLFLLKRTQRESKAGRRFETFSNSLPFWLQIFAVLLLTWILVAPRYGARRMVRQIAVVVDSSSSMQPLKGEMRKKLTGVFEHLKGDADEASYIVLDHDPRRPRIYQGDDLEDLLSQMDRWDPLDGALDPSASLRIARSLVGPRGVVAYITDHDGEELVQSAVRIALGEGRANCGFTGVTVERKRKGFSWIAVLRNYGDSPQSREWTMETLSQGRSEPQKIVLEPGRLRVLKGDFPEGADRFLLRLTSDDMPLDDVVPVIAERPRLAYLGISGSQKVKELGEKIVRGFDHVAKAPTGVEGDFFIGSAEVDQEPGRSKASIIFYEGEGGEKPSGKWLMEEHELVKGLNFQAMSIRELMPFKGRSSDEVLLWAGSKPAIVLRLDPISQAVQLVFAFPLSQSNAMKLPAVAVLLHRFSEKIAQETIAEHTAFLETGQLLVDEFPPEVSRADLKVDVAGIDGEFEEVSLREGFRSTMRTPMRPGFLKMSYLGKEFLNASVVFADTREADLSEASSNDLPDLQADLIEEQTRDDRWWRWPVVMVLLLALVAWVYLTPKTERKLKS